MTEEFTVASGPHQEWEFLIAVSFSLEGIGAGILACATLADSEVASLAGLGLLLAGVIALLAHLGNPKRFWRAISNPRKAWISRGSLLIAALLLLGSLSSLPPALGMAPLASSVLEPAVLATSVLVMLYAGCLLASMVAIPFWNTALLPAVFLLHSLASGAAVLLALSPIADVRALETSGLATIAQVFLAIAFVSSVGYVRLASRTRGARESLRALTDGELRHLFLGGAITLGLLAPAALIGVFQLAIPGSNPDGALLLLVAGLLRLGGDLCFRYSVTAAGYYEPIL